MKTLRFLCFLGILGLSLFSYQSCSGRGTAQVESYAGPGSDWDANINLDGTFSFVENDAGLTIAGDWVPQVGPFKKFTVNTSTNPGSVAVGSQAYGFDIPGVAFILKPLTDNQIVTMVTKAECPTESATMNWIITKYYGAGAGSPSASDLFGVFQYDDATGTASLPFKYKLDGTLFEDGEGSLGTFNCSNSEATLTDSPGAKMYINDVGALVNTGNQFVIGFLKNTLGSVDSLAGTYYGLLFKESAGLVTTVKGTITGSTLSVKGIETSTGSLTGSNDATLTINSVDLPKEGFVQMTLGTDTVRCMANPDINFTGKKLLFCAAKDPDGTSAQLYNLLLVTE